MTLDPTVISIAAFFGVTGLIMTAYLLFREFDSSSVEDRLDILAGRKSRTSESEQVTKEALVREGVDGFSGLLSRIADRFEALKLLFVQADSPIRPETFLLISIGCALAGVTIAIVAVHPCRCIPSPGWPRASCRSSGSCGGGSGGSRSSPVSSPTRWN